ncbi:MAG: zinc ABC transporter substrate-binding protein [Helicobacter sp.]|nr:zinc ABC transporter substrate-binding protein [Helicobacter sp.]
MSFCRIVLVWMFFIATMSAKPIIAVSIPMQKEFIQKIVGEEYEVVCLIKPGVNPHDFEPKFSDIKQINQAIAYFTIGIESEEAWLKRFSAQNKAMKIYSSIEGIALINFTKEEHEHSYSHDHDHDDDEEHEDGDTHVWLSPKNAKVIAKNLYNGLKAINPRGSYEESFKALIYEIDALDIQIKEILNPLPKGQKFVVFHPMLGYFARDYGLQEISLEIQGKSPKIKDMMKVVEVMKKEGLSIIFSQPEFSTKAAEFVAKESGAKLGYFSPLETPWAENLLGFAKEIRKFKD